MNLRNAKGDSSVTSQKNAQNIQKMDIKRREELFKKVHFVIVLISFAESSDLSFVLLMDFDNFMLKILDLGWVLLGLVILGSTILDWTNLKWALGNISVQNCVRQTCFWATLGLGQFFVLGNFRIGATLGFGQLWVTLGNFG